MFALSFKANEIDPARNYSVSYYIPPAEIKDFNALTDNKSVFNQPLKIKKKYMENLSKCQETMIIQQENYYIICTIKNILNLLL